MLQEHRAVCNQALMAIQKCADKGFLQGQQMNHVLYSDYQNNDDRILDCCLYYKQFYDVVLMTDDHNLAVKANMSQIVVVMHWNGNADEFQTYLHQQMHTKNLEIRDVEGDHVMLDIESAKDELSVLMKDVESRWPLSIERIFKKYLGNEWKCFLDKQQPWNLRDMIQLIHKHWLSVFRDIFPRYAQDYVRELKTLLAKTTHTTNEKAQILKNLQIMDSFLK